MSISGRWAAGTAAAARTNDAATYRTTRLGAFACGRLRESTRRCADSSREPDGGTRQRCDFFAAQGRWAASGSTGTQRRDERETQREERERGLQTAGGRGNTGSATTEVVGPVGGWQVVGGVWSLLPWRWWRRIGGARTRCLRPWPLPPPPLLLFFLLLFVSSSGASLPLAACCSVLPSRALSACSRRYRESATRDRALLWLSRTPALSRHSLSSLIVVEEVPSSSW